MVATKKERGVLLTIWLILMLIGSSFSLLFILFGDMSPIPLWITYTFAILALLNFVFIIFLFMWKKWAFFAFCGSVGIIFIINIITDTGVFSSLSGLLGPLVLYLILKPKWDLLE